MNGSREETGATHCAPDCRDCGKKAIDGAVLCETCRTKDLVSRIETAIERDYEAQRLAGDVCRAIEQSGERCTAPTNRTRLWCNFHMGLPVDGLID